MMFRRPASRESRCSRTTESRPPLSAASMWRAWCRPSGRAWAGKSFKSCMESRAAYCRIVFYSGLNIENTGHSHVRAGMTAWVSLFQFTLKIVAAAGYRSARGGTVFRRPQNGRRAYSTLFSHSFTKQTADCHLSGRLNVSDGLCCQSWCYGCLPSRISRLSTRLRRSAPQFWLCTKMPR